VIFIVSYGGSHFTHSTISWLGSTGSLLIIPIHLIISNKLISQKNLYFQLGMIQISEEDF
jgi:hypothetical protein